jgi:hypothetical protein
MNFDPTGKLTHYSFRDDTIFSNIAAIGAKVDRQSVEAKAAEEKEFQALIDGIVLRYLHREERQQLIESGTAVVPLIMRVDCKTKQMIDQKVHSYLKARLCANGSKQDVLLCDRSSPTPSQPTIRLFMANAQQSGYELRVLDYSMAFIQAKFKQESDKDIGTYKGKYYLIERPLYGLKTSGKLWRDAVVAIYEKMGFIMDETEPCIFRRTDHLGTTSVLIYVDDVLYTCTNEATRKQFEHDVTNTGNKLTLMGKALDFAGYSITRLADGAIHISTTNSIVKMEAKHQTILKNHHTYLPWQSETVRERRESTSPPILLSPKDKLTYQSLVGTFIYVVTTTRPECSTIYSRLAAKSHTPTNHDMEEAIHMAMYLRDTRDHGLIYPWKEQVMHQVIYTDANHGDKRDPQQRARTGALIYMGGCLIAWTSHKQTTALVGSRDAEYIAAADGLHIAEVISFMQDRYETEGSPPRPSPELHTDNEVMLKQLQKGSVPLVQRLAEFRAPQVKRSFDTKRVTFYKVHTKENVSDLLTKETPRAVFDYLGQRLVSNVQRYD